VLQRSDEWVEARLGKLTASRLAEAIARTKTGYGASRANLMAELVAERLTGRPADRFISVAMQHGIDTESEALSAYEFYRDTAVEQVGFVQHPSIAESGASPDGQIVGPKTDGVRLLGLVEFKCPNTATHIETLLGAPIKAEYVTQMQWQMACTGALWCDWVSYDPRMPEQLRLFVKRVERDDKTILLLDGEVRKFLGELEAKVTALNGLMTRKAA
jgi:hypothetical protein